MGFNDILSKLFGNKSQRDLREVQPYLTIPCNDESTFKE